jgi:hypothetical protein
VYPALERVGPIWMVGEVDDIAPIRQQAGRDVSAGEPEGPGHGVASQHSVPSIWDSVRIGASRRRICRPVPGIDVIVLGLILDTVR